MIILLIVILLIIYISRDTAGLDRADIRAFIRSVGARRFRSKAVVRAGGVAEHGVEGEIPERVDLIGGTANSVIRIAKDAAILECCIASLTARVEVVTIRRATIVERKDAVANS